MRVSAPLWLISIAPAALLGVWLGRASAPPRPLSAEDLVAVRKDAVVRAVERLSPSVVNISTERVLVVRERLFGGSDLLEEMLGELAPRRRVRQSSLGSGVIIDPEGYVVTNAHVIARASSIRVTLSNPRVGADGPAWHEASLVNISPENDLALLKIDSGGPFPTAKLGRSDDVLVGETVIALGNPFGLESSVTRGVLSATGRSLEESATPRFSDFLQTDAAINPGNSGGPLANLVGEVIGINTAVHSQAHGIGFALPITRCQAVLAELLDERELAGTWIGLELQPAAPVVAAIATDSPAAKAGLAQGDEIVSVDARPCASTFDVKRRIVEKSSGEKLKFVVRRAGKEVTLEVAVAAAPAPSGERIVRTRMGLRARPVTPLAAERKQMEQVTGVEILRAERDGPGERAGLQAGDVILSISLPVMVRDGRLIFSTPFEVRSLEELANYLGQLKKEARMRIEVLRDGQRLVGEIDLR